MSETGSEAARLLEAAIGRIERTGWMKGDEGPEEGPNCAMGALIFGAQDLGMDCDETWNMRNPVMARAVSSLCQALGVQYITSGCTVARFNDHYCENVDVLLEAMRRAAKVAAST